VIATTGIDAGASDTIAPRAAEVTSPARDRTAEFDHHGRANRCHVFSVHPSTGALSATSLTSDTWLDHRGEVIKTAAPGGRITQEAHEGGGRVPAVNVGVSPSSQKQSVDIVRLSVTLYTRFGLLEQDHA